VRKVMDVSRPISIRFSLRLMLRALLMERFGLKAHMEDMPGNAYALLAATPKLKKADPETEVRATDGLHRERRIRARRIPC
jgi:uncharacterized protein (TIGR03435 family)